MYEAVETLTNAKHQGSSSLAYYGTEADALLKCDPTSRFGSVLKLMGTMCPQRTGYKTVFKFCEDPY